MKKLVTVGPNNITGFRKHIEETVYCYDGPSKFIAVDSKGPEALKEIISEDPDLSIIGGRNWIRRNTRILDSIPGKKGLLVAGPLGQNEISVIEMDNFVYFMNLLNKKKIDYLFLGSEDFAKRINRDDVIYLPAPFKMDLGTYKKKEFLSSNIVSILNDKAVHKNILNGLGGLALSKKLDKLIINGTSEIHDSILDLFGLIDKVENVGILSKKELENKIKSSKLLIHLSYSEGLCYSALEAMYLGTPVLTTNAMPWFYHHLTEVDNPADHEEISSKIDNILSLNEYEYSALAYDCRVIAEKKIEENNEVVSKTLYKLLK
ncbi:glycosyltransferase [Candidatus Woesearchaeota archaeon]|nr:glycosyltransferase [Candidatus Woesearchaeota archaeon]